MDAFTPKPTIWSNNPKLKNLLLVFIIILLFSGIGLAVLAQVQAQYRQKIYEETQAGLPVHKVGESDIKNWRTYRNEEYGFEIEYPSSITVIQDFGKEGLFKGFDFAVNTKIPNNALCFQPISLSTNSDLGATEELPCTIYISINDFKDKSLEDYVRKNQDIASIKAFGGLNEKIIIGQQQWILVGSPEGPGIGNWFLYSLNTMSTKVAAMTITNVFDIDKKVIQDDARAIISTFKFIEKVDTSTWKTYRNEEFGFEFRYPGNWVYQELGGKSFGGFVNFYSSGKIPSSQNMVIPDIALSLFPNPKNLDLKSFYLNQSSNWFYASDSQIPFKTTNGLDGEKFIAIYGAGLDDIISIKKDLIVIELQDFNQQHANDGILDMIINSIK